MSLDRPFFSVVIPTYNRSAFILDTLATVFAQTYQNFEVIVVDNASTDNTVELLVPFVAENKIKLVRHDRNYERAKSRNTGQQHAKGDYLTFLDSDDFMYSTGLEDAALFIQQNPHVKIFHNLYELVDSKRSVLYNYRFAPINNAAALICKGNFLSCIGVFLHRDVYTTIFWDETPELVGSEDYEFWFRVIARFPHVGRIEKINSGILHHHGRTMNHIRLETTAKRFDYSINKVETTPELIKV
jgi:glycosyltransferase involved in cell wall biosynthesis